MTNDLCTVSQKLGRAKDKISVLLAGVSEWTKTNPITLSAQLRPKRLGVDLRCQIDGGAAPLESWRLDIGEIVYSLRSALDNLIYVCAQRISDPPSKPRLLKFPICQRRAEYPNMIKSVASQLPPQITELLEKIQPFQRDLPNVESQPKYDPLVVLNWLSNHDKHQMPVPMLLPPGEIEFSKCIEFQSGEDADSNLPPDVVVHCGPLRPEQLLLEYRTKHPVKKVCGTVQITANVVIPTNSGERKVADLLPELGWYTGLVIEEFAKVLKLS